MDVTDQPGADCLVVGGGLSGLACAYELSVEGHTVQVLERAATVGGRARSFMYQGEPVDRGFQALFRAYPETRHLCDAIGIDRKELPAFDRGAAIFDGTRWINARLSPAALVRTGLAEPGDVRRLARAMAGPLAFPDRTLEYDGATTREALRADGLSDTVRERVLQPLLGAITLDRALGADAGYARYLMAMLARGPAVLPVDGMGMIAQRAAETIQANGGMIWTGVGVAALDTAPDGDAVRGVVLNDGRQVAARHVVLALDTPNARALLEEHDPATAARLARDPSGMVSAAFALERPLYAGKKILLDAAAPDRDDRVDLLCQTTNVTRPRSPGPHILIAQSSTRGWSSVDPERYARAVGDRIAEWAPGYPWRELSRLIDTYVNPWAQYRPAPGVRSALPGPRTALRNVILAGDAITHPSIEGAVSSGRQAAVIVHELLDIPHTVRAAR